MGAASSGMESGSWLHGRGKVSGLSNIRGGLGRRIGFPAGREQGEGEYGTTQTERRRQGSAVYGSSRRSSHLLQWDEVDVS